MSCCHYHSHHCWYPDEYLEPYPRRRGGGRAFAGRLASMGLVVGSRLEVLQNSPRGPMLIRVRDTRIALGRGEAAKVLAEKVTK